MLQDFHRREEIAVEKGYSVDKMGNVYSSNGVIKTQTIGDRLRFNIRVGTSIKRVKVHRLQAYQKFGDVIYKEGLVVRHLNGISTDNSWDNIGVGTQGDNICDIPEVNRIANASNPKYNHDAIILDHKLGMSYARIMSKYGIKSKGTISFIVKKSISSRHGP